MPAPAPLPKWLDVSGQNVLYRRSPGTSKMIDRLLAAPLAWLRRLSTRATSPALQSLPALRLRTLLTLPFVALVLVPSLVIGGVSLYTGVQAADHLSRQLVTDISQRIERIAVYQLNEAAVLLSSAFLSTRIPDAGVVAAQRDIEVLSERLFALLTTSRTASYVYFARADGAFVGVDRGTVVGNAPAVLRVQADPSRPRTVYTLDATGARIRAVEIESRVFRAPERPWFIAALDRGRLTWTPVYRSFASGQMVSTASLPIRDREGRLLGIAAADVVLSELSGFMSRLRVSDSGIAFIVDGAGRLVAQSIDSEMLPARPGDTPPAHDQLAAIESESALIRETARWWSGQRPHKFFETTPLIATVSIEGRRVDVAGRRIAEIPGLDWHVLVAIPRDDFFAPIVRNATLLFAVICAALVATLALGLWVLGRVVRDVDRLVDVAVTTDATTRELPKLPLALTELARLEQAFRDMFERWREAWAESQARRAELVSLNETLEAKVIERTQSLASLTDELRAEVERRSLYEEELQRSTDAARRSADAKAKFVAYLSHEIRTPLQSLVSTAEQMRTDLGSTSDALEEAPEARETRRRIDTIDAACRALLSIVDGVLQYARYESGGIVPVPTPVVLGEVIDDARRIALAAAPQVRVPVEVEVASDLPSRLSTDGGMLRQIIVNLLSNALKFTTQGRIVVRVERGRSDEGDTFHVVVEDTGHGMSSEQQARLFDLFASRSLEEAGAVGHGIGLFLSRQLARALRGELTFTSAPGCGTTMRLRLPLVVAAPAPVEPQTAVTSQFSASAQGPACSILVVDDHPVNREIITGMLSQLRHRVASAATGSEALSLAQRQRFDVILMDLNLPDLSGFETTARLLRESNARGLPPPAVLALTASVSDEDRARAAAAGMSGFLSKPVTLAAMEAAVSAASLHMRLGEEAAAASVPALPVLDDTVRSLAATAGSGEIATRLLRLAREELPKDLARWKQAVADGESAAAHNAAHRIAGAAALLGAQRLALTARAFMEDQTDAHACALPERVDELLAEIDVADGLRLV